MYKIENAQKSQIFVRPMYKMKSTVVIMKFSKIRQNCNIGKKYKKVRDWLKRCEFGQKYSSKKGVSWDKKGARLGNKKGASLGKRVHLKKGARLGKKGARLVTSR